MLVDQEGTFKAKVVAKDYAKSKGGAEQLAVCCEVTAEGPQLGHRITEFLSFSDAALKYTIEKMRTMGWQGVDLADLSTLGSVEFEIVTRAEEYEGQHRMRIAFFNTLGGSLALKAPLNDGERRAFAARMRGLITGLDPKQAQRKPDAAAPSRGPAGDGDPRPDPDIPF